MPFTSESWHHGVMPTSTPSRWSFALVLAFSLGLGGVLGCDGGSSDPDGGSGLDAATRDGSQSGLDGDVPRPDGSDRPDASDLPDAGRRDAAAADGSMGSADASATDGSIASPDAATSDGGPACIAPLTACGGACVNTSNDALNCGACGTVCPGAANATPACVSGGCTITCDAGYGDCSTTAAGCETSLRTTTDCGACGTPCTAPTGGSAMCDTGVCSRSCPTGQTNCSGVCTATASDPANCGGCGASCPTGPNASATCAASTCGLICASGYADCTAAAGCETSLRTTTNCGACGVPCTAPAGGSASCATGVCTTSCPSGRTLCGSTCVDLTSDEAHCGACGAACTVGRTCTAGACNLLEFLYWINQRRTAGATCGGVAYPAVAALAHDATGRLDMASQRHANDMAANDFLGGAGTDGSTPTTRLNDVGYAFSSGYEIYVQGAVTDSPMYLVDFLFMNAGLCAQLMSGTYTQFGAGAGDGGTRGIYYSLWLARPR